MNRTHTIGWTLAIGALMATLAVSAQQPTPQTGFRRTPVQQGDLTIAGREVVQAVAEIQPGAESGRHTHPGDEVGYMVDGTVTIEIQGKPAMTKKGGEGFIIPAGTVHNARNSSNAPAKVLATYIIEKGKPPVTPVQ